MMRAGWWFYLIVVLVGIVVAGGELSYARWAYRELKNRHMNGLRQLAALHFIRSNYIILFVQLCFLALALLSLFELENETRHVFLGVVFMAAVSAMTWKSITNRYARRMLSNLTEAALIAAEEAKES